MTVPLTHTDRVLTQRDLGRWFGVTQPTVSKWKSAGLVKEALDGTYSIQATARAIARRKGDGSNRERLESAKADMAEHQLSVALEQVVPVEEMEVLWAAAATALQSRILSIPPGLADDLATEDDPAQVLRMLTRELTAALEDLADAIGVMRGDEEDVDG